MSGRLLMKGRSKMGLLWAICLTIALFLVAICSSNQHAFSQGSQPLAFESAQLESIKIDNIVPSQTVDLEKESWWRVNHPTMLRKIVRSLLLSTAYNHTKMQLLTVQEDQQIFPMEVCIR